MTERAVCIPNIGPRQRRYRLVLGVVMLSSAVVLAAYLIAIDAPRLWRLWIALPALLASLGVFQARAQTCVALAARGLRNMDDGDQAVTDAAQLASMRRQSRRVRLQAAAVSAILTVIALVL